MSDRELRKEPNPDKLHHCLRQNGMTDIQRIFQKVSSTEHSYQQFMREPRNGKEGFTLESAQTLYEGCKDGLEKTPYHQKLMENFAEPNFKAYCRQIKQVICVGIGSFTLTRDKNPFYQLAALDFMLQSLNKGISNPNALIPVHLLKLPDRKDGDEIKNVYFQEPGLNTLDKALLRDKGYTILNTPKAYNEMTPDTFLYAPQCIYEPIFFALEVEYPVLYVGTCMETCLGCVGDHGMDDV